MAAGAGAAAAGGVEGERAVDLEAAEGEDKDKCGICLENIPASGKRFGLLNCDHVYCLGELSCGVVGCGVLHGVTT